MSDLGELVIEQQTKTAMKLKVAADLYLQKFIKYKGVGVFHSYSELLFASLLESDPEVSTFTPQPTQIRVKGKRYIPDFHFVKSNKSYIAELKPNGEFDEDKKQQSQDYFEHHDMQFIVVANEDVLKEKVKATNWLHIVRTLLSSKLIDSTTQELKIISDIATGSISNVGDVIDLGNRFGSKDYEVALFNLIYQGKLQIDLSKDIINTDMQVTL